MKQKTKETKQSEANSTNPPFKPKKRKKKKWGVIITAIIVLLGIGYIFRAPLMNLLRNVPGVNQYIPIAVEGEPSLSKEELLAQYEKQQQELVALQEKVNVLEETNRDLVTRNNTLKAYETQYESFLEQKATWDQSIVKSNPELFLEQFEKMNPEVAQELYKQIKGEVVNTKEQQALAKAVGEMDEDQAAKALEVLLNTDADLVQVIMKEMKDDRKSLILSSMTSQGAAKVIKLISPPISDAQD